MYHAGSRSSARVLLTDGVDECCVTLFKERGHTVDFMKSLPEAELIKIIGDYEGLVVRSATKVNANILKHATKMRVVGRAGVGVDNIDIPEATKRGVMVMNTPGGNTVSTAQLALSLMASLARKVPAADMSVKEGKWDRYYKLSQQDYQRLNLRYFSNKVALKASPVLDQLLFSWHQIYLYMNVKLRKHLT